MKINNFIKFNFYFGIIFISEFIIINSFKILTIKFQMIQ